MSNLTDQIIKKRFSNKSDFIPDDVIIKGHAGGYVSEKDVDKTAMAVNEVIGCKNLDFYPGYDAVRQPYQLYLDLTTQLPAGYTIVRFCEKTFVDGDGLAQKVVIFAAKGAVGTKMRIYANYSYLPTRDYDNANKYETYTIPEWRNQFIELTERYKHGDTGIQYVIGTYGVSGDTYTVRIIANGTSEAAFGNPLRNFYRGWYIINGDYVVGIVTASITTYSAGVYTGTYFKLMLEDNITLTNGQVGLCRFPVNHFNADNWDDITDVRFEDQFPNTLKIWCGHNSRPLNLSFISERIYFGGVVSIPPSYWTAPPSDWLTVQGIASFSTTKTFEIKVAGIVNQFNLTLQKRIQFKWREGTGSYTFLPEILIPFGTVAFDAVHDLTLGLSVRLKGNIQEFNTSDYATFQVQAGATASWNGFWFGFDSPEVTQKKRYKYIDGNISPNSHDITKTDIGQELGIRYNMATTAFARASKFEKVYSLAVEFNGYETYFVKNVFLGHTPVGAMDDFLIINAYFSPAFDRRITGHLLYYAEDARIDHAGTDSADYELPETSRFNDIKRGYYAISKMGATKETDSGSWKVKIIDSTNTTDTILADSATGEALSVDRLNNPYWYTVVQKAEYAMRVGDNVVAVNLANDLANADKETQQPNSNGSEAICVSQLQAGANAASVMSTKRIRQITSGYPLIAGAWMTENQFMLFTEKESFWYDITEEETLQMRRIAVFDGQGLVHADAMVSARNILASQAGPLTAPLSSLFEGIYFASPITIGMMKNNKLIDLLMYDDEVRSKWQTEYQEIEDKAAIRAGYRSNTQDVYFSIPELNQIRVWNIAGKHWKIYQFPDAVKYFVQDRDGELLFHTDTKIYKTEKLGTTLTKDKGTERIDFEFSQYVNHGNSQLMKVFDGFDMTYELEGTDTVKLHLKVEAADQRVPDGLNTIFDDDITIRDDSHPAQFYDRRGYPVRDRGQWAKVTVSSTEDTAEYASTFRLLMLKLKAFFTRGNITRQ